MLSEKEIIAFFYQKGSGIGDDAALIKINSKSILISSDQLIENTHFSFAYFSPQDLAIKLVERSVSDIYVKGGYPQYAILNLAISANFAKDTEFFKDFAYALKKQLKFHKTKLIGGDTARSSQSVFSLTILGKVKKIIPRKNPKIQPGDLIVVFGEVGGSDYVLSFLEKNQELPQKIKKYHLTPKSQAQKIVGWLRENALASIDQSDSLYESLEILAKENDLTMVIELSQIPTPFFLKNLTEKEKFSYALHGGEDLAVVAIISQHKKAKLPKGGAIIGKVKKKNFSEIEIQYLGSPWKEKLDFKPFAHFGIES